MTRAASYVLLDGKFIDRTGHTFRVFLFDSSKTVSIHEQQDTLGQWRRAKTGEKIQVRIPDTMVQAEGLLGDHTYGTGGKGNAAGGSGSSSSLMG